MAAADSFEIVVHAKGGHRGDARLSIDPILVASHIVAALSLIHVAKCESVGQPGHHGGNGSGGYGAQHHPRFRPGWWSAIRTLTPGVRDLAFRRIEEVATNVAAATGQRRGDHHAGMPVASNASEAVARFREAVELNLAHSWSQGGADDGRRGFQLLRIPRPGVLLLAWSRSGGESVSWAPRLVSISNDGAIETGIMAMCSLALSR
ncbi:MAG: hypothetical protein U0S12_14105 [Fimbriimonadales bacterium]